MPIRLLGPKTYRVTIGQDVGKIRFSEAFWEENEIFPDGTTPFDGNVESLLADLRVALYWLNQQRHIQQ